MYRKIDRLGVYRRGFEAALQADPIDLPDQRDLDAVATCLRRIIKKREISADGPRRRLVRELLIAGLSQSEIARKIGVTPQAVHYHVREGRMRR